MAEFKREERYLVLKLSDIEKALTQSQQQFLNFIASDVAEWRKGQGKGKADRQYVCISDASPHYQQAWDLVKADAEGRTMAVVPGMLPSEHVTELTELRIRLAEAHRREEVLEEELREKRRKLFVHFNDDECWVWNPSGSNYLHSLICPVVIDPDQLREIQRAGNELVKASQYLANADAEWVSEKAIEQINAYGTTLRRLIDASGDEEAA